MNSSVFPISYESLIRSVIYRTVLPVKKVVSMPLQLYGIPSFLSLYKYGSALSLFL